MSLFDVGELNNLLVMHSSKHVSELQAVPVSGIYTLTEVLDILLAGLDLRAQVLNNEVLTVSPYALNANAKRAKGASAPDSSEQGPPQYPQRVDEVVIVTGSWIPRANRETNFHTVILDQKDKVRLNLTNLADMVESSAIVCSGAQSLSNTNFVNNTRDIGQTFPDVSCLGSNRSLTLVNGRRMVPTASIESSSLEPGSQFDINVLPLIMVESIETIGVGTSPIYGSGAIAGTTNVRLRDHIDGVELVSEYGISDYQDGEQYRVGFAAGTAFGGDHGHISFAYERQEQERIDHDDRPFTASNRRYTILPDNLNVRQLVNDTRLIGATPFGIPSPRQGELDLFGVLGEPNVFVDEQNRPLTFNEQGQLVPFNLGSPTIFRALAIGGDGERLSEYRTLRLPLDRHALYWKASYDFSPALRIYMDMNYSRAESSVLSESFMRTANFPNFNLTDIPLAIRTDDPFLSEEDRQILSGSPLSDSQGAQFYLHKAWIGLNGNETRQKGSARQVRVGTKTDFFLIDGQRWGIETYLSHGESKQEVFSITSLNAPIFSDFSEVPPPIRRFGRLATEDIDALRVDSVRTTRRKFYNYAATMNGELATLHGGKIQLALGYEYIRFQDQANEERSTDANTFAFRFEDLDSGSPTTKEWFSELRLPLIGPNWLRGLNELSLEGSYRKINSSQFGENSSNALGIRLGFDIFDNSTLLLRGNSIRSYRAPAFQELSQSVSLFSRQRGLSDPCLASNVGEQPQRALLCGQDALLRQDREILNANFEYNADTFDTTVNGIIPVAFQGNDELDVERGASKNIGLTLNVGDVSRWSIDAVDVEISDVIDVESASDVLSDCYDRGVADACDRVFRFSGISGDESQAFALAAVSAKYQNFRTISTQYFQWEAEFMMLPRNVFPGEMWMKVRGRSLSEYSFDGNDFAGDYHFPKQRFLASLDYRDERVFLSLSADRIGDGRYEFYANEFIEDRDVAATTRFHFGSRYRINPNLALGIGVRNIFNQEPPPELESTDITGEFADIGRYYTLRLDISL